MTEFLMIIAFLVGIVLHDWTRKYHKLHSKLIVCRAKTNVPFRAEGAAGGTTAAARSDDVCREDFCAIAEKMRTHRAIEAKTSVADA